MTNQDIYELDRLAGLDALRGKGAKRDLFARAIKLHVAAECAQIACSVGVAWAIGDARKACREIENRIRREIVEGENG